MRAEREAEPEMPRTWTEVTKEDAEYPSVADMSTSFGEMSLLLHLTLQPGIWFWLRLRELVCGHSKRMD
ncbi:unnamed protein product [Pleuronectes platessa]|uniref:Uncharacterized protein n=1 Tax=Pleuronectes platessa TaxID=8262 RepID=A0A9N7UJF0_PLEPL|nr:unnamed protein product [Pleuronectes platessa]